MIHSDTPLIVEIILEGFGFRGQGTVSHPKKIVVFHFAATQILTECVDLVNKYQHNGNYRMIPF